MSNAIKRFFENGEFDCDDMVNHSSAYTDNDLKPDLRPAFQAHLSKCEPCQAFVGTLSSTIGDLGKLPGIRPEAIANRPDSPGELITRVAVP